jgi:hypothetical protein
MTRRPFATRPTDAEQWVRTPDAAPRPGQDFTARLTIDVTPALRGRIKVAAFQRGQTVADMLRGLLIRAFPDTPGDPQ